MLTTKFMLLGLALPLFGAMFVFVGLENSIVFFISYMSLVKRERKEMLIAGGAFAAAVFVTYLLMGMGALKFLSFLNEFSVIAKCVYLVAAVGTFTLAFLSLYDAIKAKQGKVKEIKLQLPKSLKLRIHKVIREQTRTSGVIIGALAIGFAISALELVCTGRSTCRRLRL